MLSEAVKGVHQDAREVRYSVDELAALLPLPKPCANKYTRGVLDVIAGSAAYPGAAVLAARAAARTGAGYTHVWCAPEAVDTVRFGNASLVVSPWQGEAVRRALVNAAGHPHAVLIGCGFTGAADDETQLLCAVLESNVDVAIDAGGLTCLARLVAKEGVEFLQKRASSGVSLILTPHAGEAARLLNALGIADDSDARGVSESQEHENPQQELHNQQEQQRYRRFRQQELRGQREIACGLSAAYGATVVLKGPQTVVAQVGGNAMLSSEDVVEASCEDLPGTTYLIDCGTPALAKAGTGDVLAGMIAALLAQGLSPFHAGVLGSYLHACAGVAAAAQLSPVCVIPEDVIEYIPCSINELLHNRAEAASVFTAFQ